MRASSAGSISSTAMPLSPSGPRGRRDPPRDGGRGQAVRGKSGMTALAGDGTGRPGCGPAFAWFPRSPMVVIAVVVMVTPVIVVVAPVIVAPAPFALVPDMAVAV